MSEENGASANTSGNDEVSTLKAKNDSLYAEHIHLKKQLESYTKLGNPDDLRGRLEDYEGLRKTTAKTPEEIDRIISDKEAEFERRYSGKYSEYETENKTLREKVQHFQVITPTMQKAASIFRDTELDLVNMLVERDLAFQDEKIIVKGQDGKPLYSVKNPRELMGVDEYLEGLSTKYPAIAKPKTIGTGKEAGETSAASGDTSGDTPPANFSQLSREAQQAWFIQHPAARDRFLANGGKF